MALSEQELRFAADRLDSRLRWMMDKNLQPRQRAEQNALKIAVRALRASASGLNPMEDEHGAERQ